MEGAGGEGASRQKPRGPAWPEHDWVAQGCRFPQDQVGAGLKARGVHGWD